jgi:hypothetical protein
MGSVFGGGGTTITNAETPLSALQIQSSSYGVPIPIVYGQTRVSGNLIWYGDFTPVAHYQETSSGGKGGGGGVSSTNITYTYTAAFAYALCEGPIQDVPTAWVGKDAHAAPCVGIQTPVYYYTTLWYYNYTPPLYSLFTGGYPQAPWTYLQGRHPDQALGYQGLAYVAAPAYDLQNSNSLPNQSFEVKGTFSGSVPGSIDACPADILIDYLTNPHYGAGISAALFGDFSAYRAYTTATGLLLSPCYDAQQKAADTITNLMQLTNSGIYFSEGKIKITPYGDAPATGHGATYTPNLTPVASITDDALLGDSSNDPVIVRRNAIASTISTTADAYNQVQVEYLNRANKYNTEIATAQDQAAIDQFGLLPMSAITGHEIADPGVAATVAQLILERVVYIRNQYEFKIGWNFCYLEPTDIITLTDTAIGLNNAPVRVLSIEEDDTGLLSIVAEDAPPGAAQYANLAPVYGSGGGLQNLNASPGRVAAPAFYERRDGQSLRVGVAVAGMFPNYGGCIIWISTDGSSYYRLGSINGSARYGTLNAPVDGSVGASIDVTLAGLGGQLLSASLQDAQNFMTESWLDGEIVAYQSATLTALNRYTLGGLQRGGLGSSASSHAAGSTFIRMDSQVIESDALADTMVGQSLYFKFQAFNTFGGGMETLDALPAYQYAITGSPLYWTLPNVQGLTDAYRNGNTVLLWQAVTDAAVDDYEIRKGAAWKTAQVLGRVVATEFLANGDDTYWVAARAGPAYSATPSEIIISGARLVDNVIATFDEAATHWSGTLSGGAVILNNAISLRGAGLFSAIPLVSAEGTIAYYGGVSPAGEYDLPATHSIDIGNAQACAVSLSYVFYADDPFSLFSSIPLVSALPSVAGSYAGKADCEMQMAIAGNDGVYADWRDYAPGQYVGRKFKFRALLTSNDPAITPVLSGMTVSVDVPDRVDTGNGIAIAAAGSSVTYATPFHATPNVQITILSAQQGDDPIVTGSTANGFNIQIINAGVGVARTINWVAQGY